MSLARDGLLIEKTLNNLASLHHTSQITFLRQMAAKSINMNPDLYSNIFIQVQDHANCAALRLVLSHLEIISFIYI